MKYTPVLLLTGYLGSGKTTLLNRILANQQGIRFAVIVNDIGEVNIDADLIQKGGVVNKNDDSLVALQNGCICCTLKMDLVSQLKEIVDQDRFDYIVIEASGICEPAPIAQTICAYRQLVPLELQKGAPKLDSIVTVVDALRMQSEFACGDDLKRDNLQEEDIENLVIQQIEFCNVILLNKASEVSEDELNRIRCIIKAIQPKAEIIPCDYCDIDLNKLVNTNAFDFDAVATSATWIDVIENENTSAHDEDDDDDDDHEHHHEHHHEDEDDHEHHHEDEHDHHHHHHHQHDEGEALEYGIDTFVYYNRRPFSLNKFDEFVARYWPKSVIRAKGMCYFSEEYDICYLFEQAGKQFSVKNAGQWFATMPKEELMQMMAQDANLRRDWDDYYGDRMQKLVFIGQHMDKEAIIKALDDCLD